MSWHDSNPVCIANMTQPWLLAPPGEVFWNKKLWACPWAAQAEPVACPTKSPKKMQYRDFYTITMFQDNTIRSPDLTQRISNGTKLMFPLSSGLLSSILWHLRTTHSCMRIHCQSCQMHACRTKFLLYLLLKLISMQGSLATLTSNRFSAEFLFPTSTETKQIP